MNLKILSTVAAALVVISGSAFAAKEPAVAMITGVEGKALVENAAGDRMVAKANMPLAEGYSLLVLEKAKVGVKYVSSSCKTSYSENTLLTVAESAQCAKGQKIAVGQAGGVANAAGRANKFGRVAKIGGLGGLGVGFIFVGIVVAVGSNNSCGTSC